LVTDERRDLNVLVLVKGGDRYVLLYDDAHAGEARDTVRRWALEPTLNFGWREACVLIERIVAHAQQALDEAPDVESFDLGGEAGGA